MRIRASQHAITQRQRTWTILGLHYKNPANTKGIPEIARIRMLFGDPPKEGEEDIREQVDEDFDVPRPSKHTIFSEGWVADMLAESVAARYKMLFEERNKA